MSDEAAEHEVNLVGLLDRSAVLDERLFITLGGEAYSPFSGEPRILLSLVAAWAALEHGRALRLLVSEGLCTSAAAMSRLQFEALARSLWLFYAAPETDIQMLAESLSVESEAATKRIPMMADMLKALAANPHAAHPLDALRRFQVNNGPAINSYVHTGIHALQRVGRFPPQLASGVVRNSNGLSMMTANMLAVLAGNQGAMQRLGRLGRKFAAVLPDVVEGDKAAQTAAGAA